MWKEDKFCLHLARLLLIQNSKLKYMFLVKKREEDILLSLKYRPQFYVRTTDVTGEVTLPDGVEMVMPGDDVAVTVELISPVAMEDGMKFAIRGGGRTVGAGVVSKIIQ